MPSHRLELAASLGNIGATFTVGKKDHAAGLAYFREASAVLEGLTRSHPDVIEYPEYLSRSHTNLASVLSTLGRFEEALAVGQAAGSYLEGRVRAEPKLLLRGSTSPPISINGPRLASGSDNTRRPIGSIAGRSRTSWRSPRAVTPPHKP